MYRQINKICKVFCITFLWRLQLKKENILHQSCRGRLKIKPGLPKLSLRFTAFPDREGLSSSKNESFVVWVETSCYSLLFWLWFKREESSPDKIQWYGWSFPLNFWVVWTQYSKQNLGDMNPHEMKKLMWTFFAPICWDYTAFSIKLENRELFQKCPKFRTEWTHL